jgi:hypothetical protein
MTAHMVQQRARLKLKNGDNYARLVEGCDAVLAKLNKYQKLAKGNIVHVAAAVCDPRQNFQFIRVLYEKTPDRIHEAERQLRNFFETFRDKSNDHVNVQAGATEEVLNMPIWEKWSKPLSKTTTSRKPIERPGDEEFRRWTQRAALQTNETIGLPWWQGPPGFEFPTWKKMACSLFCIPASSAEVERVFSRSSLPLARN